MGHGGGPQHACCLEETNAVGFGKLGGLGRQSALTPCALCTSERLQRSEFCRIQSTRVLWLSAGQGCGAVQATFKAAADEMNNSLDTIPDLGLATAAGLLYRGMVKADGIGRVNAQFIFQVVCPLPPASCWGTNWNPSLPPCRLPIFVGTHVRRLAHSWGSVTVPDQPAPPVGQSLSFGDQVKGLQVSMQCSCTLKHWSRSQRLINTPLVLLYRNQYLACMVMPACSGLGIKLPESPCPPAHKSQASGLTTDPKHPRAA